MFDMKKELDLNMDCFNDNQKYIIIRKAIKDFKDYCFIADKDGAFSFKKEVIKNIFDEEIFKQTKESFRENNKRYLEEIKNYKEENKDKFETYPFISIDRGEYDKLYYPYGEDNEFNVIDTEDIDVEKAFIAYKFFNIAKTINFNTTMGTRTKIMKEYSEEYNKFINSMKIKYNFKTESEMEEIAILETNKTDKFIENRISNKRMSKFESMPILAKEYIESYRKLII